MRKPKLEDAVALAAALHRGQVDKIGVCYLLHPLRVMLDPSLQTDEERITAVLHDTVEDCGITFGQLRRLGYSEKVLEALGFLTKLPHEEVDYAAFIQRIRRGPPLARKVKLADLRDNTNPSRMMPPNEHNNARQERYRRAIETLEATTG
ncbi:MAG TPA: GTP pyrophosphokinase [Candidatus Paceibacterota bacterium]